MKTNSVLVNGVKEPSTITTNVGRTKFEYTKDLGSYKE